MDAAVRLEKRNQRLHFDFVLRMRGDSYAFRFPDDDHALIGLDWHPVEAESLARLRRWQAHAEANASGGDPASLEAAYSILSRDSIDDQLSDADVWTLAPKAAPPPALEAALRAFQLTGFRWLFARAGAGKGSILADGMGSGKTIQTIAVLAARRALGGPMSLVAVPTTLLENWRREVARFAPQMVFYIHHGPRRSGSPNELREAELDLVITSHETAARDSGTLGLLDWDLLVVDEAQRLRNPDAVVRSELGSIRRNASLLLTGTPLENRPLDLWSLVDFVEPGYLGSRESFSDELAESRSGLRSAVRPILLRRPPEIVLADMPDLVTQDVHLSMYEEEAAEYQRILGGISRAKKRPALALITRLRSFVAFPTLDEGDSSSTLRCAKLDRAIEMLEEAVLADEKVVVFCWFRRAAAALRDAVGVQIGVPVFMVDGEMPVERRQPTIDEFSSVPRGAVLVLNTRAAGVGLNIQAAQRVIHYTLEWNPAAEDQATARVWRSGQTRTVIRHRLVYDGTIDEIMVEKMAEKRVLFAEAVPEGEVRAGELSRMLADALTRKPVHFLD